VRAKASEIFPASERQYIRASQSEQNLKRDMSFSFYSALQSSSDGCGIYRTYGNPVSVRFPLFQHQHSTNVDCFWVTRCLCKLDLLPSGDNTCILHTRVNLHKTSKNRLWLGLHLRSRPHRGSLRRSQTSSRWAWGKINSQHSLDCHLTSSVPSMKKKTILDCHQSPDTMRQRLTAMPQV